MKSKSFYYTLLGLVSILSSSPQASVTPQTSNFPTQSLNQLPDCINKPDFISEIRADRIASIDQLPKAIYVAKEVEYYIEGHQKENQSVRAYTFQSFDHKSLKNKPEVVCGRPIRQEQKRFSILAPTLIDLTQTKNVGNSMWQFQVLNSQNQLTVWNQKSSLLSKSDSIDKTLKEFGSDYQIFQISYNEYEVLIKKSESNIDQYLSVRYEVYPQIK